MNRDIIGLGDFQGADFLTKSFASVNETDEMQISLAFNSLDLMKGKKSAEGDERIYKNKVYIKSKLGHWTEKKSGKTLKSHAREAGEHHLKATIEEGTDPLLRKHAHDEMKRREKYEYPKKDENKK